VHSIGVADGQVTRVARYFAVVAVAGEIAQAALSLPWQDGEPVLAAKACFQAWLGQRVGFDRQEILSSKAALRETISVHGQSRFQHLNGINDDAIDSMNSHPVRDLLGYRFDWQEETVWGFTSAGIKEVLRGFGDTVALVKELAERGVIRRGNNDRLQIEKKIGGIKRRLYAVPDSLVEQE
jgi:hypothetical protein